MMSYVPIMRGSYYLNMIKYNSNKNSGAITTLKIMSMKINWVQYSTVQYSTWQYTINHTHSFNSITGEKERGGGSGDEARMYVHTDLRIFQPQNH